LVRHRQRACLEAGLKLDINRLLRDGTISREGRNVAEGVRRDLISQKDTPPGSKYDVPAAPCLKPGL
jgi:hypothetical protein